MSTADQPYRRWVNSDLHTFRLQIEQSDLLISTERPLAEFAERALRAIRQRLETYIARDPEFAVTFKPHHLLPNAPSIARDMVEATRACGVGPMAAVAGAIAQHLGEALLKESGQVIVENGGDIFLHTKQPRIAAIFAGASPLSGKMGIRVNRLHQSVGLCTSSATVGPSLSLGSADAAIILAESATLADAAASFLGNQIHTAADIETTLTSIQSIRGIWGGAAILGEHLGAWGELELVALDH
jgi:uncharacterized protein